MTKIIDVRNAKMPPSAAPRIAAIWFRSLDEVEDDDGNDLKMSDSYRHNLIMGLTRDG
jgi:hypothetical protein